MGLGKTLTMISLILKQRAVEHDKLTTDNGNSGSESWLSAGQKGMCIVRVIFSNFFSNKKQFIAFAAFTLLIGCQKKHLTCRN